MKKGLECIQVMQMNQGGHPTIIVLGSGEIASKPLFNLLMIDAKGSPGPVITKGGYPVPEARISEAGYMKECLERHGWSGEELSSGTDALEDHVAALKEFCKDHGFVNGRGCILVTMDPSRWIAQREMLLHQLPDATVVSARPDISIIPEFLVTAWEDGLYTRIMQNERYRAFIEHEEAIIRQGQRLRLQGRFPEATL